MTSKKIVFSSILLLFGLVISVPAYADAGIPMLVLTIPALALAFIPVVIIEGYILFKYLKISKKLAFKTATISNLVSTFIGIPITWIAFTLVDVLVLTLVGLENQTPELFLKILNVISTLFWGFDAEPQWMRLTVNAILLIPFFFISWLIELKITKKILKLSDEALIKKAVLVGNLISYGLLELLVLACL